MADDIANLGFAVDTRQLEKANKELDKLEGAAKKAGDGADEFARDADKAAKAADRVGKESRRASAGLEVMKGAMAGVVRAAIAMGSALLGALSVRSFIRATVEAEDKLIQLNAVLKSTGGIAGQTAESVLALSRELQKTTRFNDEAVTSAQSLLLTFTKIQGDIFPRATRAALDMSTAMGSSLQTAIIQVGKALNDPVRGVTALSEAGIQFTNAQRDMIRSLVDTNQVAAAQVLILKELETQFGGSATAARDTLGGAITAVQNAFGDLLEIVGPARNFLKQAFEDLARVLSSDGVVNIVQMLGQSFFVLSSYIIQAIASFVELIGVFGETKGTAEALQVVVAAIATPFVVLRGALIAVILSLRLLIRGYTAFVEMVHKAGQGDFAGAFEAGKKAINDMRNAIQRATEDAKALWAALDGVKNIGKGPGGKPAETGPVRPSGIQLPTVHHGMPNFGGSGSAGGVSTVKLASGEEIRVHKPSMGEAVNDGVAGLGRQSGMSNQRLRELTDYGRRVGEQLAQGNSQRDRVISVLDAGFAGLRDDFRTAGFLGDRAQMRGNQYTSTIGGLNRWDADPADAEALAAAALVQAQVREANARASLFEAQHRDILSQSGYLNPTGMATGGMFDVPTGGARDSFIPNIKLDGGERVTVTPRNEVGKSSMPAINVTVVVQGVSNLSEFRDNKYVIEQQARQAIARAAQQSLRGA